MFEQEREAFHRQMTQVVIHSLKGIEGMGTYQKEGIGVECHRLLPGILYAYFHSDEEATWENNQQSIPGDYLEISYCSAGKMEVYFTRGRTLTLSEGNLSLNLKCQDILHSHLSSGFRCHSLMIDLTQTALIHHEIEAMDLDLAISLTQICQRWLQSQSMHIIHADPFMHALFSDAALLPATLLVPHIRLKSLAALNYLSYISQNDDYVPERKPGYLAPSIASVAQQIYAAIVLNPYPTQSTEEWANAYGIKASSLERAFKSLYGYSLFAHSHHERLEKAADYLRNSNEEISLIAERLGFKHASKFSSQFKQKKGLSPRRYRQEQQSKALRSRAIAPDRGGTRS